MIKKYKRILLLGAVGVSPMALIVACSSKQAKPTKQERLQKLQEQLQYWQTTRDGSKDELDRIHAQDQIDWIKPEIKKLKADIEKLNADTANDNVLKSAPNFFRWVRLNYPNKYKDHKDRNNLRELYTYRPDSWKKITLSDIYNKVK